MSERTYEKCPIAIVGMSCRLPGASSPEELWSMLVEGRDAFSPLDERWQKTLIHPRKHELKPPVPRAGLIDDIEGFDASFFGISPREAGRMDPQQRILLELAWEAFEDAGIAPDRWAGERVGVFVGSCTTDYWSLTTDSRHRRQLDAWTALGGMPGILANRISHALDFRGPSLNVDSACSASLFAVHLAKLSLDRGESALALACGVGLLIRPENVVGLVRANMLSPTGTSSPFGQAANGYVRGEGAGCVLLKRLDHALRDGDRVYAVIHGSAVSQDGRSPGITVPTVDAQVQMLRLAYADAQIDPRDIAYVEAHGTGTPLGDPIEPQALGAVIGRDRSPDSPCRIGSIKSNIGHLEAAAGIAGLIKTTLCLHRNRVVPSLNCDPPNPAIPFDELGLEVVRRVEPLAKEGERRLAGVSAFGFGGTNAHVVLESAEHQPRATATRSAASSAHLFPLSARHPQALQDYAERLAKSLERSPHLSPGDVSHTLSGRRAQHACRASIVAATADELVRKLGEVNTGKVPIFDAASSNDKVAFIFTGMGPQWPGMARFLLREEPTFRASMERTDRDFAKLSGWSILAHVFARDEAEVPSLVDRADIGHPAHFAVQVALCELLKDWGVGPTAIVGHSAGEVTAAYVAGRLSWDDSLRVLYHRSRLVQRLANSGRMLAVALSKEEALQLTEDFDGAVCVAAVNSPSSVALSGPVPALEKIAAELDRQERWCRFVDGCFPYHSAVFEVVRDELLQGLEGMKPLEPAVPIIACARGAWSDGDDFGPAYWWQNVRACVQFEQSIKLVLQTGCQTFVEIGASPVLLRSVQESAKSEDVQISTLPTLRRNVDDAVALRTTAGELWARGFPVQPSRLEEPRGAWVGLPTYAWQHRPYWIEKLPPQADSSREGLGGHRLATSRPTWQAAVSETQPAWAGHHRISGQVFLPAAAWIDTWLSAAQEIRSRLPIGLRDIRFSEVLVLGSEPSCLKWQKRNDEWTLDSSSSASADVWTRHGSARTHSSPSPGAAIDLETLRSGRNSVGFDYDKYRELGYEYGPAFRSVAAVWPLDQACLAELSLPAEIESTNGHFVHPVLLDGAWHAFLGGIEDLDGTYVPLSVKEVVAYRPHDGVDKVWALSRILHRSTKRIVIDVTLHDSSGQPLLSTLGVEVTRIAQGRSVRRPMVYEERWISQGRPLSRHPVAALMSGAAGLAGESSSRAEDLSACALLNELAAAYVLQGEPANAGHHALAPQVEAFVRELGRAPRAVGTLRRLLVEEHPEFQIEHELVAQLGRARLEVETEMTATLLHASRSLRPAVEQLRYSLEQSALQVGRPARVLFVGASGLFVEACGARDRADETEYTVLDWSSRTAALASLRSPNLEVLTLRNDASLDQELAALERHTFDAVIVSESLGRIPLPMQPLIWCRELVTPGGRLFIVCPSGRQLWTALANDLPNTLRSQPAMAAQEWTAALVEAGFREPIWMSGNAGDGFVLLAARFEDPCSEENQPLIPAGARWLVLSDDALGKRISEELRRAGRECHLLGCRSDLGQLTTGFDRVIYLAPSVSDETSEGPVQLLQLVGAIGEWSTQLTVITQGAQRIPGDRHCSPGAASIWGFARVLGLEFPTLGVRLIDVPLPSDLLGADMVLHEIARFDTDEGGSEREVALRPGVRRVPRVMVRGSRPHAGALSSGADGASPEGAGSCLGAHEVEVLVQTWGSSASADVGSANLRSCVGKVLRRGSRVRHLALDTPVVGVTTATPRTTIIEDARLFCVLPSGLDPAGAATLPVAAGTALLALRDIARLRKGDPIFIQDAETSIGLASLQIARTLGARVLVTADRSSAELLVALGAEVLGSWDEHDLRARLLDATAGSGVKAILTASRRDETQLAADMLRPGGVLLVLRDPSVTINPPMLTDLLPPNTSAHVVDFPALAAAAPHRVQTILRDLVRLAACSEVRPLPWKPATRLQDLSGSSDRVMDHPYQLAGTRTRLIRDDATYLVTGGLRGFGLATARWLVGLGARHLVLLGRTGAAHEDAKLALAEFRSSGVDVRAIAADVSRLEEVQAAVKCCRAGMPPLKGVFHAAMVLDDVSIAGMSVEALRRVLDAKAVGAWNLHTATVDLHLDLFVLFSSVSRLFAHPGQANYVAANQFLFALADLRHTGGLAATCVDWGVIGDTGVMFRSSDLIERVDRSGIRSMSSAHALAVLESLLLEDAGNVGVFDVDWSVVDAPLGFARSLARYDRVRHLKAQTGEGTSAGLQLEDLRSAAPEQVMDVAREFVRDRVGLVLRRVASEIDEGVALMQLGFDSLMEIELRGLLRTDTGIDLANVRLARDASVERIARILLERLDLSAEVPVPDTQEMGPFLHWISEREAALESAISGEESEFAAEMLSTVEELSVRASQLPMHEHEPRRRIVRAQLGRFFLRSSLLRWAYEKPLGYPGDFELMKRLYVAEPTGDGIDRLIDRFSIERPTGQATRNRAPYLRSLIREVIRSKAPARARIASVGCGPAWEIRTLLAESPELSESIELVLVDQDERALKDCESALGGWRERGLALKLLCCPIEDLVRAQSSALASLGARDLLYSSGLFDYFNDGNFEVYLQALYEHIAPGGALVVGNLSAASPDRWFIEYLADWFLYYRTKEQLLERGQSLLPEPSSVRVEAEPVGINLFLAVQRPGRRSDPPRS